MAKTGRMFAETKKMQVTIILNNGSMHRSLNNQAQIVTFDKYRLYIPLQPPNQDPDKITRGAMTMSQLLKGAKEYGDTPSGREFLVHFHKRLVLPVGCLLLSLIGLSLGLQAGPGKPAIGVPLGLGFYIIYYILFTLGKQLAESSSLPVGGSLWSTDVIFLFIMLYMIRQTANERPFFSEHVKDIFKRSMKMIKQGIYTVLGSGGYRRKKSAAKTQYSEELLAQLSSTGKIHGNAKSRVFHLPECEFYNCKNCTIEFLDLKTAFQSGFEPCRFCKEILGAISS
jgi:lipopolysaccharide export system permease protein